MILFAFFDCLATNKQTFRDVVNLLSTTENPAALPLAYRLQTTLR